MRCTASVVWLGVVTVCGCLQRPTTPQQLFARCGHRSGEREWDVQRAGSHDEDRPLSEPSQWRARCKPTWAPWRLRPYVNLWIAPVRVRVIGPHCATMRDRGTPKPLRAAELRWADTERAGVNIVLATLLRPTETENRQRCALRTARVHRIRLLQLCTHRQPLLAHGLGH